MSEIAGHAWLPLSAVLYRRRGQGWPPSIRQLLAALSIGSHQAILALRCFSNAGRALGHMCAKGVLQGGQILLPLLQAAAPVPGQLLQLLGLQTAAPVQGVQPS